MAKRVFAVVAAATAVAAIAVAGLFVASRSSGPETAPSTAATPTINTTPEIPGAERKQPKFKAPVPNFASLSDRPVEMFGKLTFPRPQMWGASRGEESSAGDVWRIWYSDTTTCTAASPGECPQINFIDQDTPEGKELLGEDPVKWWTVQSCGVGASKHKTEGPVSMKLGGQSAKMYRVRCGAELVYDYAWFVPGKKLVVTGSIGSAGALAVETIQAALERVSWTS